MENDTPINILNYIKRLDFFSFSNVYIVYRIMLTIHIIVVSLEKNSELKLIISYLRSTCQQRFNKFILRELLNEINYDNFNE